MKYLITYNYDDWNSATCAGVETCDTIDKVNDAIRNIKSGLYDCGDYPRNIKVYKAEEITEEFDTKTDFDDEKDN